LRERPGTAADDGTPHVAAAERWLEALRALGLGPSVFLSSGRGCWTYWKLGRHVPQLEAEALMRRLYAQLRPEDAEHDVGRVARMPGSTNEKTSLRAFVMAIDGARWDPDELARLLPEEADSDDGGSKTVEYDRALGRGGRLPALELPEDPAAYLASRRRPLVDSHRRTPSEGGPETCVGATRDRSPQDPGR
jgi:hypothetical protein